jgi:hypothetical protein
MDVNPDRLNEFMGKMLGDMGAAANAALIKVGDRLGLYKALAAKGPMTPAELAKASGTTERCIREWLSAQAAAGYVDYDPATGKFHMEPEQKMALADEDSPVFIGDVMAAIVLNEPKISEAFKTGKGVGWNDRAECLFCGTALSSVHPTSITWCRSGCRHWMGWSISSSVAPKSPMSAAAMASRPD